MITHCGGESNPVKITAEVLWVRVQPGVQPSTNYPPITHDEHVKHLYKTAQLLRSNTPINEIAVMNHPPTCLLALVRYVHV